MQTPAQGVVMAPVSPAVAKLLHKLQAQIIKDRDESTAAGIDPGAVVLPQPSKCSTYMHPTLLYCSVYEGGYGYTNRRGSYQRRFGSSSQAPWFGHELRRDALGREWQRDWDAVVDDFGNLVEVAV